MRSTTARTGPPAAPPTPTPCSSPAPDHGLITNGHYQTTITDTGRLAWTDGTRPPEIIHAHHPEELLRGNTDPPNTQQD
jgi:hypothetical protein